VCSANPTTALEIAKTFPQVDVVFIGADTTGTLMGCARYFRESSIALSTVLVMRVT